MAIIATDDKRLIPVVDGVELQGVVGYTYRVEVDEVVMMEIELLAPECWQPPMDGAELTFEVSQWPQRARDAMRRALDAADGEG